MRQLPPDAAVPALALPEEIGPPAPFDRLRPQMKHADAMAALAGNSRVFKAALPEKFEIPDGATVYELAPGIAAHLMFYDARLHSITIMSGSEPALVANAVFARWNNGTKEDSGLHNRHTYRSSSGWLVTLEVPKRDNEFEFVKTNVLTFASHQAPGLAINVTDQVFPQLSKLLGAKLDVAVETFGSGLQRETADGEETSPERVAPRQGFGILKVKWTTNQWQMVLQTDASERVTSVLLTGPTTNETERTALFDALRAAFGAPRAGVSRAGRLEIELGTGATVVRCVEPRDGAWEITIARR